VAEIKEVPKSIQDIVDRLVEEIDHMYHAPENLTLILVKDAATQGRVILRIYVNVEEMYRKTKHEMKKGTSELVKAILSSGYEPVKPEAVSIGEGAQIIDGQWYLPRWGCDTLQHVIEQFSGEKENAKRVEK